MQQQTRHNRFILGLLALGVLVMVALMANPAQAASGAGPYLAEPAWDRKLPASTRFLILTNWFSSAVLDKETGLVWERSPSNVASTWVAARTACMAVNTGARRGWRLPTIHELASLADPSVTPGPALPAGHPFLNVSGTSTANYWSATADADNTTLAWIVHFGAGDVFGLTKAANGHAWCVRGGMHVDRY